MLWREPVLERMRLVLVAEHAEDARPKGPISGRTHVPQLQREKPSKSEMVTSWRSLFEASIAGHSARRSGPMAYVRKGMGIRDLAYLGRWKSSVVLTSAEEALETTPANRGLQFQEETSVAAPKTPSRILVEAVVKKAAEPGPSLAAGAHVGNRTKAASLWVKSLERRSGNPLHYVTIADWSLAMSSWSTACGWTFAKKSAQIAFVTNPAMNLLKCKECLAMKNLRDSVNKDVDAAQMVAGDMDQLTRSKDGGGRTKPQNRPLKVEGGSGCAVKCLRSL
jgi:hypothetical protein